MTLIPDTPAGIDDRPALPTCGEIRAMTAGTISLLMRESDDPNLLFLLSLRREEMARETGGWWR